MDQWEWYDEALEVRRIFLEKSNNVKLVETTSEGIRVEIIIGDRKIYFTLWSDIYLYVDNMGLSGSGQLIDDFDTNIIELKKVCNEILKKV